MIKEALAALRTAERPVLIYGAGVRLAGAADEARELARLTGVPVAPTWGARDLFPEDPDICVVGGFGTHGTRAANFAVQNADWILSVGSRLDSKATGMPRRNFARAAAVYMADIDLAEVRKFGGQLGRVFVGVQADAKLILRTAIDDVRASGGDRAGFFADWRARCEAWKARYPACPPAHDAEEGVDPYVLMRELSAACLPGEVVVSDTGLSLAWLMQGFAFKHGQTFIHALNQTPMGYGLPAAIGATFARPGQRVVLVTGDGGLMLNIQELALLARHRLPIKIVLLNNGGHAMCRQTQEQWLGGKYYSTSVEGGLCMPDFCAVAEAFGLQTWVVKVGDDVASNLRGALTEDGPTLTDVRISPDARLVSQVPYGRPIEDGNPPLPRAELAEQMIVGVVE
jgi:acetolactate synthase I/II/III large subunit